ncbi:N-acetylglucosamine-6-phosphate deacetylase [Corynebacterium aurimucosum]|uniref:N-acetylglucosamine-6-phosphate deacetylase n=1 Tax=Corynebacterium aurimucosum (strain ATCC 700975 / DSM 44827 / CIP 107346 / CN-1) TaxID=548476 RepID=C3PJW5_CORA7|nr:amidohydrolase family protein [Corynebacterium aurimucosum]ACP31836.1 N-acetylglucosamine-6-phosphate deacetylase [Corynebacterium aurimucosum ATCC 700975]QQU93945.1 amidohydrolase family protein [Corynebacterium aurimucosum]
MQTEAKGHVEGLYIDENFELRAGAVTFGENIEGIKLGDVPQAEAAWRAGDSDALLWVPGFVDLHNHGGNGGGFPNGDYEQCLAAARFHRAHGTTTLLASLVSGTQEELCTRTELLAQLAEEGEIAGIHMEGPFIAAAKCGAQDPSRIVPGDPDFFRAVIAAARGHLRSITFAPETDNADKLLEVCAEHGIIASLGHTEADYDTMLGVIAKAKELGLTVTGTHLFNGMPSIHHRAPGPVAALLTAAKAGDVSVELIADGVHLVDGTVDMVHSHRAFAITDAMAAAGMADGDYELGSLPVTVSGGVARVPSGAIAGGTSTLAQQFASFAERHGLGEAVRFTSTTAADVLGEKDLGRIAVGARANLVGLNAQLEPVRVIVGGAEFIDS